MRLYLNLTACIIILFSTACYVDSQPDLKILRNRKSVIDILLGDARKIFRNLLLRKADIYFHSGRYPSFFEKTIAKELAEGKQQDEVDYKDICLFDADDHEQDDHHTEHHDEECGFDFLDASDWISRINKQRQPLEHSHLETGKDGMARQLIPWLKMSNVFSPEDELTSLLLSYWLCKLEKQDQAIKVLLQAIMFNPDSYELYAELGHVQLVSDYDTEISKQNLLKALLKWNKTAFGKDEKDTKGLIKIYLYLVSVCEKRQEFEQAIFYLQQIKKIEPERNIKVKLEALRSMV